MPPRNPTRLAASPEGPDPLDLSIGTAAAPAALVDPVDLLRAHLGLVRAVDDAEDATVTVAFSESAVTLVCRSPDGERRGATTVPLARRLPPAGRLIGAWRVGAAALRDALSNPQHGALTAPEVALTADRSALGLRVHPQPEARGRIPATPALVPAALPPAPAGVAIALRPDRWIAMADAAGPDGVVCVAPEAGVVTALHPAGGATMQELGLHKHRKPSAGGDTATLAASIRVSGAVARAIGDALNAEHQRRCALVPKADRSPAAYEALLPLAQAVADGDLVALAIGDMRIIDEAPLPPVWSADAIAALPDPKAPGLELPKATTKAFLEAVRWAIAGDALRAEVPAAGSPAAVFLETSADGIVRLAVTRAHVDPYAADGRRVIEIGPGLVPTAVAAVQDLAAQFQHIRQNTTLFLGADAAGRLTLQVGRETPRRVVFPLLAPSRPAAVDPLFAAFVAGDAEGAARTAARRWDAAQTAPAATRTRFLPGSDAAIDAEVAELMAEEATRGSAAPPLPVRLTDRRDRGADLTANARFRRYLTLLESGAVPGGDGRLGVNWFRVRLADAQVAALVRQARAGDAGARRELSLSFTGLCATMASETTRGYRGPHDLSQADRFATARLAIEQTIDGGDARVAWDDERGKGFVGFAWMRFRALVADALLDVGPLQVRTAQYATLRPVAEARRILAAHLGRRATSVEILQILRRAPSDPAGVAELSDVEGLAKVDCALRTLDSRYAPSITDQLYESDHGRGRPTLESVLRAPTETEPVPVAASRHGMAERLSRVLPPVERDAIETTLGARGRLRLSIQQYALATGMSDAQIDTFVQKPGVAVLREALGVMETAAEAALGSDQRAVPAPAPSHRHFPARQRRSV